MTLITIQGNIATEIKEPSGTGSKSFLQFLVISSKGTKNDDGTWTNTDATAWSIKCWGFVADNVSQGLKKGDGVIVVGDVAEESWEDSQTKEKRTRMVVKAFDVGPSLRRHSVTLAPKAKSTTVSNSQGDDPWAAAGGGWGNGAAKQADTPPF